MLDINKKIPDRATEIMKHTPIERWYNKLRLRSLRDIRFENDGASFSIKLPPGTQMEQKKVSNREQYEPGLTTELMSRMSESEIFYDIGAHFGYTSMIAREAGINPEHIYAFERSQFRASVYEQNHATAGAQICRASVGDGTDESGMSLDKFASDNKLPTILKIDVEGDELLVLRGAEVILSSTHPTIYCEVHTGMIQAGTVFDLIELLKSYGYSIDSQNHFSPENDWHPARKFISQGDTFLLRGL
jgi:hypothetical protein